MSNPEETKTIVALEIGNLDHIEEIREVVIALPALTVNERFDINENVEEAVEEKKTDLTVSETGDVSESPLTKKPRVLLDILSEASASIEKTELMKQACSKKYGSVLTKSTPVYEEVRIGTGNALPIDLNEVPKVEEGEEERDE